MWASLFGGIPWFQSEPQRRLPPSLDPQNRLGQLSQAQNQQNSQRALNAMSMFGAIPPLPSPPSMHDVFVQQMLQMQTQALGISPKPETPTKDLPLVTDFGEIVAWRAWVFDLGRLKSPYRETLWAPGAIIKSDHHPYKSSKGIFAHKTCERVLEQESDWSVIGTVMLWGDVVEHEYGYRAEFARIEKLHHFASGMTDSFKAWLQAEFAA